MVFIIFAYYPYFLETISKHPTNLAKIRKPLKASTTMPRLGIWNPFPRDGWPPETKVRNHQTTIGSASTITQTVWSLGSLFFFCSILERRLKINGKRRDIYIYILLHNLLYKNVLPYISYILYMYNVLNRVHLFLDTPEESKSNLPKLYVCFFKTWALNMNSLLCECWGHRDMWLWLSDSISDANPEL